MNYDEYVRQKARVFELIDGLLIRAHHEKLDGAAWLHPLIVTLISTLVAMQRCGTKVTFEALLEALRDQYNVAREMPVPTEAEIQAASAESADRTVH